MRIVCLSDIHGILPTNLPTGDILLIAGDICPTCDHSFAFQKVWLEGNFREWLYKTKERIPSIVYIAGNHDFIFQKSDLTKPSWINWEQSEKDIRLDRRGFYYLQDSGIKIGNLKIWGTPHQRRFYDWAFNLDEPQLAEKWSLIPSDTDIIMCHGPAYGYGDMVINKGEAEHVGSPSMLKKIDEIKPKLYVSGHIHSGRGIYKHNNTIIVNASYVNERYKPYKEKIITIDLQ